MAELLENFHIDIGKDGKEIYETFDNGKSKTRFSATDLKELKKKEMEFLQTVQNKKSRVSIKKEPLFSKELDTATSIDDDYKVRCLLIHNFRKFKLKKITSHIFLHHAIFFNH